MQVLKVIYYFKNTKYNINAVIKVDCIDICDEIALFFTVTITLPHHLQSSSITSLTIVIVLCLYSYHSTSFTAIIHCHHSLPSSLTFIILCHHSMSSFYVILLCHPFMASFNNHHLPSQYIICLHHSPSVSSSVIIIHHHYSLS